MGTRGALGGYSVLPLQYTPHQLQVKLTVHNLHDVELQKKKKTSSCVVPILPSYTACSSQFYTRRRAKIKESVFTLYSQKEASFAHISVFCPARHEEVECDSFLLQVCCKKNLAFIWPCVPELQLIAQWASILTIGREGFSYFKHEYKD